MCSTEPLTVETHDRGRLVAERYGLSVYDAMIVAAALLGGCESISVSILSTLFYRDLSLMTSDRSKNIFSAHSIIGFIICDILDDLKRVNSKLWLFYVDQDKKTSSRQYISTGLYFGTPGGICFPPD